MKKTIAVLGAGSWGTAVAIHLAAHHQVLLWARDKQQVAEMCHERLNRRYLPQTSFPSSITPSHHLRDCVTQADYVIIAVPSHAFSHLIEQFDKPKNGIFSLTKGLDPQTHHLLSQVIADRWGDEYPCAFISGPSFAKELAAGLPTAVTVVGKQSDVLQQAHTLLHFDNLRVYSSDDLIGVQLCGAVKNVLAIACGISDGLGFGANAQAALITRGLAEMSRLGCAMGAKTETFLGLAGVGDLVLTCTDNQSRNRRFGVLLGKGATIDEAEKTVQQVVEGKHNAKQVCQLATLHTVEMPICLQVFRLLKQEITPQQAVAELMNRMARKE